MAQLVEHIQSVGVEVVQEVMANKSYELPYGCTNEFACGAEK